MGQPDFGGLIAFWHNARETDRKFLLYDFYCSINEICVSKITYYNLNMQILEILEQFFSENILSKIEIV